MIEKLGWHFPDIDSHFQRHVGTYPENNYQKNSTDTAYRFVKQFNNVIDVGANIGLHTVRFSQSFNNVFSFEPVKSNFECLEKNTSSCKNVTLFKCALGNENKTEIISLPKNSNNCGAYSLIDFINFQDELIEEEVQVHKLDDFNLKADLIKIDTQGYENLVLIGAVKTIQENLPVLIVEIIHQHEYENISPILESLDYRCISTIKKDKIWVHKSYEN